MYALNIRELEKSVRLNRLKKQPVLGEYIVVETNRGVECGKVVFAKCCMAKNKKHKAGDIFVKRAIRSATKDDLDILEELSGIEQNYLQKCKSIAGNFDSAILIKKCELLFDKKKIYIHFIYTNDKKRKKKMKNQDLGSLISNAVGCKIELKEAGVRGIAKVLGGVGICGRSLCCSSVLNETKSVTIKSAKEQGITMNPKSLCGLCGKLKCCLRYERDNYMNGVFIKDNKEKNNLEDKQYFYASGKNEL
ncbi:MAG: hypothetical protein GY730_00655 [bacterium]|nr:hypothetical protein [bacterium]